MRDYKIKINIFEIKQITKIMKKSTKYILYLTQIKAIKFINNKLLLKIMV